MNSKVTYPHLGKPLPYDTAAKIEKGALPAQMGLQPLLRSNIVFGDDGGVPFEATQKRKITLNKTMRAPKTSIHIG
jgi:hypothetical protein